MSIAIGFNNVIKRYGDVTIIPGLSLKVEKGELFTLLGPSGCGKTTLLRMVAGFNSIEGGEIDFNGNVINDVPVHKRNIGIVFQNYAIFPHMTVSQNVEYGLKNRKMSKEDRKKKVDEILKIVQIEEYRDRIPEKLSGGQQQRVALARAVVIYPDILLMDEPLSNLDAKLRIEMRAAIREIQKKIDISTIYVTHDQEEALAISDRIAVMYEGVIQQVGTPQEIYLRPSNEFVATFIGHSNILNGEMIVEGDKCFVVMGNGYKVKMDNIGSYRENKKKIKIAARPEEIVILKGSDIKDKFSGKIVKSTFLGKDIVYIMKLDRGEEVEVIQEYDAEMGLLKIGDEVDLCFNKDKINVFTQDGRKNLIDGVEQYVE